MFKGEESITFDTSKSLEEVSIELEEALQDLGKVSITKRGSITIESKSKYKTTFVETTFEGSLNQSKKTPSQFTLSVSYEVKPAVLCWIIAVIGTLSFCFGFLILLLPYNTKSAIQKDVLKTLTIVEDSIA